MEEPSAVQSDNQSPEETVTARTVAAIDIGANLLRMVIAEVTPTGEVVVLERLQRAVRLGQDAFRLGRLGGQSMRAAVAVLRDYTQLLRLYNVERIRAVATSAVREASNADTLLDRMFMATGLNVEVIDTAEESRLIVSAVCDAMSDLLDADRGDTLIADVGGGSTLLTLLHHGEIVTSQSLRLGSVRLREILATNEESPPSLCRVVPPANRQGGVLNGTSLFVGQGRYVRGRRRRRPICRRADQRTDRPGKHESAEPGVL